LLLLVKWVCSQNLNAKTKLFTCWCPIFILSIFWADRYKFNVYSIPFVLYNITKHYWEQIYLYISIYSMSKNYLFQNEINLYFTWKHSTCWEKIIPLENTSFETRVGFCMAKNQILIGTPIENYFLKLKTVWNHFGHYENSVLRYNVGWAGVWKTKALFLKYLYTQRTQIKDISSRNGPAYFWHHQNVFRYFDNPTALII